MSPLGRCEFCGNELRGPGKRCIQCDSDQNLWHAPRIKVVRDLAALLLLPLLFFFGAKVYEETEAKNVVSRQILESSSGEMESLVDSLGRFDTDLLALPCFDGYSNDAAGIRKCEGELFKRWNSFDAKFVELTWKVKKAPFLRQDTNAYWQALKQEYWGGGHRAGMRYTIQHAMLGDGSKDAPRAGSLPMACVETVTSNACAEASRRVYRSLALFKAAIKSMSCLVVRDALEQRVSALQPLDLEAAQRIQVQLRRTLASKECTAPAPLPSLGPAVSEARP
ncbi:hypothetical protein D7X12_23495 [Corallococcus sicarius]|uniref:Uncharacterized protein n=1 Tax=Corallococcus sicarius TaxID=2316726 RepID=A0A3A8NBD0_9BACT|nr:hypothetical protein D7X12_23495 [Corallococcus sicarius]